MSKKLLALGNVLMGDDGIAIYLASALQEQLSRLDIEVIYGETDIGYSLTQINEEDYIIVLDAADFGKLPGEVSLFHLTDIIATSRIMTGHCVSFLDLIKLYKPQMDGAVLMVQVADINFRYGLSRQLESRLTDSAQAIMKHIINMK